MFTNPLGGGRRRPGSIYAATLTAGVSTSFKSLPFTDSAGTSYVVIFTAASGPTLSVSIVNTNTKLVLTSGSGITIGSDVTLPGAGVTGYCQSGDRLWIFRAGGPFLILSRTAVDTFTLYNFDDASFYASATQRVKVIPFRSVNATTVVMSISAAATGTGRTLTSSDVTKVFYVDEWYKITDSVAATTGACKVTTGGTGTCTVTNVIAFGANVVTGVGTSAIWSRSSWGHTGVNPGLPGFPLVGCFYQGRLVVGNTTDQIDTTWGTESLNYFRFLDQALVQWTAELQTGVAAAFQWQLASQQVNAISWMVPAGDLAIGTTGDEFVMRQADPTEGFGPGNIESKRQSSNGSNVKSAVLADDVVVFTDRTGRNARGFLFNERQNSYNTPSLSEFSEHIFRKSQDVWQGEQGIADSADVSSSVMRMEYAPTIQTIFFRDNYFGVSFLTLNKQQEIASWGRLTVGGNWDFAGAYDDSNPLIRDICVTPSRTMDLVWMIVTRTVGGSDINTLEFIPGEFLLTSINTTLDSDQIGGTTSHHKPIFADCSVFQRIPDDEVVAAADVSIAGDTFTLPSGHGWWNGLKTTLTTSGTVPAGLTAGATYFIVNVAATTVKLALTAGGTAINLTSQGTGNHTLTPIASAIWDNLDHLIGQTVKVLADGAYVGSYTVAAGGIVTLDDDYSETVMGLSYTHKLKSVRPEAGSLFGLSQGDVKRIDQVTIRFNRTLACKYGRNEDDTLIDINFRPVDQAMDDPVPMFTGDKKLEFQAGYDRDCYFYIEGSDPLPCEVVGIYLRGVTYD